MESMWTEEELTSLSQKFGVRSGCKLHAGAEDFHFPQREFLAAGYSPPGGYVKDFSLVMRDGRLHLFHIDGRPGEICWITGNEVSFGHASTSDFRRWVRHKMPLAVGDRSWESEHVWAPYVYKRENLYYMFYMGSGCGETFISYATSEDLETWTRSKAGPIRCAVGRDPFVLDHDGKCVLVFTGHGGARVSACSSSDMLAWEPMPDLLRIPGGLAAESSSLHPLNDGYVLWFNDCRENLVGFRAAYALSKDPFVFQPDTIREFEFRTRPDVTPNPEFPVTKPIPLSIELIARSETVWFVSYFRWQTDRNRLFFGELDWSSDPAVIREISDARHLQSVLERVGL